MSVPWCLACGRDLQGQQCPHCDQPIMLRPVHMPLEERIVRCVSRNPGCVSQELLEFLEIAEDQREYLYHRLTELVRRGSLRIDRVPNASRYYATGEGKLYREQPPGRPAESMDPMRISQRNWRTRRKEAGLCVECAQLLEPSCGHSRCESCREIARDKRRMRRQGVQSAA